MRLSRRTFLGAALAAGVSQDVAGARLGSAATPRGSADVERSAGDTVQHAGGDGHDPWIEVDAGALARNVATVTSLARRPILAVAKNNAYGLGIDVAAGILEPMPEVAGFAVVRASEAHALRDAGVRKPVLLMARVTEAETADLVRRDVELCVAADDDPPRLSAAARASGRIVPVHFYVDTGMSRMGVPYHRAPGVARALASSDGLRLAGTFMAFTEEPDFDREQLDRFTSLIAELRGEGIEPGRLHAASSNAVFHLPDAHLDAVRPGIALYGAYPSRPDEERAIAELRPAFRLCARVVRVERLREGDTVSYGRRYVAERPVWIATLPAGHADGYPRAAVEGARVLIGNRLYPVIGAVSASHTIIEVGPDRTVSPGDVATLIGPDHEAIRPNAIATAIGVSVYDLLMHLNPLLPRVVV
jgi:alanine racemase